MGPFFETQCTYLLTGRAVPARYRLKTNIPNRAWRLTSGLSRWNRTSRAAAQWSLGGQSSVQCASLTTAQSLQHASCVWDARIFRLRRISIWLQPIEITFDNSSQDERLKNVRELPVQLQYDVYQVYQGKRATNTPNYLLHFRFRFLSEIEFRQECKCSVILENVYINIKMFTTRQCFVTGI